MTAPATAVGGDPLLAAYGRYDYDLRARRLMVADVIAFICVPAGVTLDYLIHPEHLWDFFLIRLGVDAILLAIILTLRATRESRNLPLVKVLGVASTLVINFAFCLMIFQAGGAKSPYYAGINLIITGMAALLPWATTETIIVCAASFAAYLAACIAYGGLAVGGAGNLLFNNAFFIVNTSLICIAATYFLSRARFEDFRLRHRLDEQNRELQDLDRLKTQFFSNVSHELRTPLTVILGPAEGLLEKSDRLDADTHESLLLIHRNSLRLLKLINDLLDLTRIDQGSEVLRKRSFDAEPFLKGIVDSVRHLGLSKRLKMRAEGARATLQADPARLEKVVVNLLTNAIKYTNPGGQIIVRWREEDGGMVIEVVDTGVGIPAEDLPRIFDRFHQVRSNLTNQTQGVGIGLALAKELVEEHGGRLDVASELGQGTTFSIHLPPGGEVPAEKPLPSPRETDEPFERAFRSADRVWKNNDAGEGDLPIVGQGEDTILVADDENDMRQYIVSLLSHSYRVIQARSGDKVPALVAAHAPDLVLLDWMMPGRDGLDLVRELRSKPEYRDLKMVLVTARIDEKSKLAALEAGADDFLTKPFSSIELLTRAANLIQAGHLQKDLRLRNDELTEALKKLQMTEARLIQSEKMNAIESLSAGLLHEINNPLNYTLTAIDIAKRGKGTLSPDMQEIIDDVHEGMTRIRDVITHLKNFAYPEKPGTESTFSLDGVFRDACKIMSGELKDIRIDADLTPDLLIRGQKTQITHLFMNLLGNAAKALHGAPPSAGPRITVRGRVEEGRIAVDFQDNGPGIPDEIRSRVFEPFFTTREVGSGLGMGLSICHTIITSHSGTIDVSNAAAGGALFTMTFPPAEELAIL